ncbi:MAG: hypothetical protein C4K58_06020 [Flavobacteriaceae bacterium]|nr:MAG: hypothetical protein C4K58_06020 [Flavobacteriaceae bacterium]
MKNVSIVLASVLLVFSSFVAKVSAQEVSLPEIKQEKVVADLPEENYDQEKQDIKNHLSRSFMYMKDKDFDALMEYSYPKIFDHVTKEQMIGVLEETYNNPELEIDVLYQDKINSIGQIRQIEDYYYSLINYEYQLLVSNDFSSKKIQKRFHALLNETYGSENVTFNPSTNKYTVNIVRNGYACSKNKSSWSFIEIDMEKIEFYKLILPEELVDEIQGL